VIADAQGESGAAFGGALGVGDAVNVGAGDGFQTVDESPDDSGFVSDSGVIGGSEGFAARFHAIVAAAAEFGEIFDGGADAGAQFVDFACRFPSDREVGRCRDALYRGGRIAGAGAYRRGAPMCGPKNL